MPKTTECLKEARQAREVRKLATRMMASMSLSEATRTAQEYAGVSLFIPEERELWRQVGLEIEREWGYKSVHAQPSAMKKVAPECAGELHHVFGRYPTQPGRGRS